LQHGFDPANEMLEKKKKATKQPSPKNTGIVKKAYDLFIRQPVLGALFFEVILFQSLSTVINVCFL